MNKNKFFTFRNYWGLVVKMLPERKHIFAQEFLLSEYGLECRIDRCLITDDSKFTLFMLKYPEHIVNVLYE